MNRFFSKQTLTLALTLMGGLGLHFLLRDFGYAKILAQTEALGWNSVPIIASFLFLFSFLSLAWWILLKGPFLYLFGVTLVAMAWNNIGPVSKSFGEPTRVYLLSSRISVREAMSSMFIFNLVQAMGTCLVFGIGALVAPFLFSVHGLALGICLATAAVTLGGLLLILLWVNKKKRSRRPTKGKRMRFLKHWLRWISHQIRKFAKNHPSSFAWAVVACALARTLEGTAFYAIFRALGVPLTFIESLAVDIGRGIADNAFFFIPYQLGTRELSILYVAEHILGKGKEVAITASLVFRLGELFWIILGYFLGLWLLARVKRAKT